jgi:hypothetical protein
VSGEITPIINDVAGWPGIATASGPFGSTRFCVQGQEIGNANTDGWVNVRIPRALRDQMVDDGLTCYERIMAEAGWILVPVNGPADVANAYFLLRLAYLRALVACGQQSLDDPGLHAELDLLQVSTDLRQMLLAA